MGLHIPRHPRGDGGPAGPTRRWGLLGVLVVASLALSGCGNNQFTRLAMPDPATEQGKHTLALWQGAWIAALATGVLVWGLIAWVCVRYRRRSEDEIPVQTRYNLPLEIFYTIAPVIMVVVFFSHTVSTQNIVLSDKETPDNTIEVVGQQWSWTFNYGLGTEDASKNDDAVSDGTFAYDDYAYVAGTAQDIPTLMLPVDETTRFNLWSPDVIHDFGVPAFLVKMDVIPGRVNHYQVTPTRIGKYRGACYELCGLYHSRMLFNVEVVSQADYATYLQGLQAKGATSQYPLLGGREAYTQAGLETPEGVDK